MRQDHLSLSTKKFSSTVFFGSTLLISAASYAQEQKNLDFFYSSRFETDPVVTRLPGSFMGLGEIKNRFVNQIGFNFTPNIQTKNELKFRVSYENETYPSEKSLNRHNFNAAIFYTVKPGPQSRKQLRYSLSFKNDWNGSQRVLTRVRAETQLKYKLNSKQQLRTRFRIGYRDQNEDRFSGFDQSEIFLQLGYSNYLANKRWKITTTGSVEHRNAEFEQFSYTQTRAQIIAAYKFNNRTKLETKIGVFNRKYEAPFSSTTTDIRNDTRSSIEFKITHKFKKQVSGYASIGLLENKSNIVSRDYNGPVFSIGMKF